MGDMHYIIDDKEGTCLFNPEEDMLLTYDLPNVIMSGINFIRMYQNDWIQDTNERFFYSIDEALELAYLLDEVGLLKLSGFFLLYDPKERNPIFSQNIFAKKEDLIKRIGEATLNKNNEELSKLSLNVAHYFYGLEIILLNYVDSFLSSFNDEQQNDFFLSKEMARREAMKNHNPDILSYINKYYQHWGQGYKLSFIETDHSDYSKPRLMKLEDNLIIPQPNYLV